MSANTKRLSVVFLFIINMVTGQDVCPPNNFSAVAGVAEVHGTFGAYDILAKIESATVENLRETITWKIRKIDQIRSTLTLMGIEGQA